MDEALQECDLAIQALPSFGRAHNSRGMILEELGKVEEAVTADSEAVHLDLKFFAARENLSNAKIAVEQLRYRQVSQANHTTPMEDEAGRDDIQEQELETGEVAGLPPFAPYLDERGFILVGWPGHRTRPGRSGYDPLDTDFELAHMEGMIVSLAIRGKFRTQNPVYLIGISLVGILFCLVLLPMGLNIADFGICRWLVEMLFLIPYWIIGVSLLVNVYLSITAIITDKKNDQGKAFY